MKYWQKIFLCVFSLFILALNGGAFWLVEAVGDSVLSAQREQAFGDHGFVYGAISRDMVNLKDRGELNAQTMDGVFASYAQYYGRQGLYLMVYPVNEETWLYVSRAEISIPSYSSMPQDVVPLTMVGDGAMTAQLLSMQGEQYQCVVSDLPRSILGGGCRLVTARSAGAVLQGLRRLKTQVVLGCAVLSGAAAVLLIWILRSMTEPIRVLCRAGERIRTGDLSARAELGGKDELSVLAASLNAMAERVQSQIEIMTRQSRQKQRFVDDLAHELRTPITAIGGYAQYLMEANASEEERYSALSYISRESRRIGSMSERLLILAGLRNTTLQRAPVELPTLIGDAVRMVSAMAKERGVTLCQNVPEGVINTDGTLLYLVIANLLTNALRACEPGGWAQIAYDGQTIAVSDNGRGMEGETLGHITQPFYRGDKARSRAMGGTGLGLSIAAAAVEKLGMTLSFASAPGRGTKAVLQLFDKSLTACIQSRGMLGQTKETEEIFHEA